MTTPLFPSVIAWNVLDGGTDAQDGNNYPGPALQDYAAAVVGAVMSDQSYVSFLSMIGEDQMDIVSTYTALPTAAANYRRTYWVTDQKAGYLSDGTNWLPLSDRMLYDLGSATPPTMTGTTELILAQFLIPAGCWRDFQDLWLFMTMKKNGVSENVTGRIRVGTTGTVSDTLVNQGTSLSTTSDASGIQMPIKRISATSIQKLGNGSFGGSLAGASSTDIEPAATVANLDTNAVYVSLSALSSAAAETVSLVTFSASLSK